ncbi:MAG TPA: glycosyltransferase family 4 protein [Thermoanaerobaculia bacterium]|nr:glycosyltransferase family 4 protein [Thermoanaerobaculia bacterium]
MRILLVANTLPPADLSGVGEQVLQLASGLRQRGDEVEILGRGPGGARGPKLLFPLAVLPALALRLRRFRPEVVQVHESDGALAALLVRAVRRWLAPRPLLVALLQVSYVEERRAVRPLSAGGRILGRPGAVERRFRWLKAPIQILFGRLTARVADRVLAPSRRTAGELARDYGVRDAGVLPNATGGLPREAGRPTGAAAELPAGELLFVGRLRLRKGGEVLLAALARMAEQGSRPRLLVAGDGEHRAALEAEARRLGLGGQVVFLGRRGPDEIASLLAGCRGLVVPSIYEGMPLVVLEAMAAGRPVVASAVSGIPEVVLDGATGWLVPPEEPEALARALAELLGDPAEGARRGTAGRERVARDFSPGRIAERWHELVEGSPEAVTE